MVIGFDFWKENFLPHSWIFTFAGRYWIFKGCYLLGCWCDAGYGILYMLFALRGEICLDEALFHIHCKAWYKFSFALLVFITQYLFNQVLVCPIWCGTCSSHSIIQHFQVFFCKLSLWKHIYLLPFKLFYYQSVFWDCAIPDSFFNSTPSFDHLSQI